VSQPPRYWNDVRLGRGCLRCGLGPEPGVHLERAHVIGRRYDEERPCPDCRGHNDVFAGPGWTNPNCGTCQGRGVVIYVDPLLVVTLCRHTFPVPGALVPGGCHPAFDSGRLDILDRLTHEQQAACVAVIGIEGALARLAPSRRREAT
jgi:hypothetical protein